MQLEPYVFFNGQAEEALTTYADVFGGKVESLMRYDSSPMAADAGPDGTKVMHASFKAPGLAFMAADRLPKHGAAQGDRVALSLATSDAAEAKRVFERLADGGVVEQPLAPPFWGGLFGMLTDRYGVDWMVSVFSQ